MITRNNILVEYPRIPKNILPKELQQEEFDSLAEDLDLIDKNEVIGKCADTFRVTQRYAGKTEQKATNYIHKAGCNGGSVEKSRRKGSRGCHRKKPST